MRNPLAYPFDIPLLSRKRRSLRTELSKQSAAVETRIALLGGSTTSELKDVLDLFLLDAGIRATFRESGFGKYEEEVLLDDSALRAFDPTIAIVHTTWADAHLPEALEPEPAVAERLKSELARFEAIWTKLESMGCTVIQNNFDVPMERSLGHLDGTQSYGRSNFLRRLNLEFANAARRHARVLINDIAHLSATVGLTNWHDRTGWFSYKLAVSPAATVPLAHQVAALVRAVFGFARKVLILDLDNTLWGGVIGDDGLSGIALGHDTPSGEAFIAFQRYCLELKNRGILLAVCSKNDAAIAMEGFSHPDSVLKLSDFAAFKANWDPKDEAIQDIAHELNLGLDSFVFVDDNPAERDLVSSQLPRVAVPDMGSDPARFVEMLDGQRYFEPLGISDDDLRRNGMYAANAQRNVAEVAYPNYGAFLDSLEMKAEIAPFNSLYLDRIAQLVGKSNQFNLTARRYTAGELDAMRTDPACVTLYARLADRFGDNGLVSVVAGHVEGNSLRLDLWLMSCRVLKRDLELAVLDEIVSRAATRGLRWLHGEYVRTAKNGLAADHYAKLGFERVREHENGSEWRLDLQVPRAPRNVHIQEIRRG